MADFRGRAPSSNVEDRRSPLYGILASLMSTTAPFTAVQGNINAQAASNPDNLPRVPRIVPGGAPMEDVPSLGAPPVMPPPMMPPGNLDVTGPRLMGGAGSNDIRGMAANDMLSNTPAPRADAGAAGAPPRGSGDRGPAPTRFSMNDVDAARQFIASRTIHYRMGDTSPEARAAAFNLNPVAAVRSANLIAAGEEATGANAIVTEAWRSDATQAVYRANRLGKPVTYNGVTYQPDTYVTESGKTVTRKTSYPTAPPGRSNHREGGAIDFSGNGEAGKVRSWMTKHASEFGMRPIRGDDPHLEVNEGIPLSAEEADYVVRELGYTDVRDYQAKNGLGVDGVVGPETTKSMLAAVSQPSIEAAADPSSKPYTVYSSDVRTAEEKGLINAQPPMTIAEAWQHTYAGDPFGVAESKGAAQDALLAAAGPDVVDFDATVERPPTPRLSVPSAQPPALAFAPEAPIQGSQTGDRTMSQRNPVPRLNNQVGDRTMDQRLDPAFSAVLDKIEAGQTLNDADKATIAAWQEQGGEPNEPIVQRARELLGPHPNEVAAQAAPLKPDGTPYEQPPGTVPATDRPAPTPPVPRLRSDAIDYANVAGRPETPAATGLPAAERETREPTETEVAAADRTPTPPVPRLRSTATPPATETEPEPNRRTIARGDKGDAVRELQEKIAAGMPGLPSDFIDGEYGPYTEGVVMALQERAARTNPEILVDGVVGDQTWPLIDAAVSLVPSPTPRPGNEAPPRQTFEAPAELISSTGTDIMGGKPPRIGPTAQEIAAKDPFQQARESRYLAGDLMGTRALMERTLAGANGRPPPGPPISGGTDVLSGTRGNSLVPRLTSGRSGPPIRITSSAPTVAALPRDMNTADFPVRNFDYVHDAIFNGSGLQDVAQWAGLSDGRVTQGRSPANLSLDAMTGSDANVGGLMEGAFAPVRPASTTAPPPAPRLPAATSAAPTAPGTPGAATPPAGGGVAGVYSGGGPTGGPPATYSSSSSGSGPGAGSSTSTGTASTGSSGGASPPSYYDSSRGGWQSWNPTTQSYQSTGVV